MGPISQTLLGLLLLAILVTILVKVGQRFEVLDATLARGIIYATLAVIGVVVLVVLLNLLGVGFRLP